MTTNLLSVIELPDGATLHKEPMGRQLWYLARDNHHVRYLNEFEAMFIDAALAAGKQALEQALVDDSYWAGVICMFLERLNHGPQTVAASGVLALLNDCQYLASLSHPQATEPADTSARQNSLTATAMMQAPHGATYVWCNQKTWYAMELRRFLKRADLHIEGPRWLDTCAPHSVRGQIIVDHALRLTPEQRELINHINERNKP